MTNTYTNRAGGIIRLIRNLSKAKIRNLSKAKKSPPSFITILSNFFSASSMCGSTSTPPPSVFWNVGTTNGIFYTINGGETMTQATITDPTTGTSSAMDTGTTIYYQGNYYGTLAAYSTTYKTLYYSITSGTSWEQSDSISNLKLTNLDITYIGLGFANNYKRGIFTTVGNGIYYTSDTGTSWSPAYYIASNGTSTAITTGNIPGGNLISFTRDYGGVLIYVDSNGKSLLYTPENNFQQWYDATFENNANIAEDIYYISFNLTGGSNGVLTTFNKGIYLTSDSGSYWSQSSKTTGTFNEAILQTGYNSQISYNPIEFGIATSADDDGILYSENGGKTWSKSNISSGAFYGLSFSYPFALAFGGNSSTPFTIHYSINAGKTWTESNFTELFEEGNYGLPYISVISYQNDDGTSYTGYGIAYNGKNGYHYYSIDSGANWTKGKPDIYTTGPFINYYASY
jgi:hypothetical protein